MKSPLLCPFAEGTDILKFHYVLMSLSEAKKVDREILKKRGPVCAKPVHPGSCMCREHMRFSRGYEAPVLEYPISNGKKPAFTCHHSPEQYDSEERWISHDRKGNFAGEFKTEGEAKKAVDEWNSGIGKLVTEEWKAPPDDASECHRGTYIIGLKGTGLRLCTGSQDSSGEIQKNLRSALVKYGFEAVSEILFAGQSSLTRFGWDGKKE